MSWIHKVGGKFALENQKSELPDEFQLESNSGEHESRIPPPVPIRNANTVTGKAIEWDKPTWPPIFRVLHIDLSELVPLVRANPALYSLFFWYTMTLLVLNWVTWTVLAARSSASNPWAQWVLSLIDVFLGFFLLAAGYFTIFRACAEDDSSYYTASYCLLGVITALCIVISIVSFPFSFNGWTRFNWIDNNAKNLRTYWRAMTAIESAGWTLAYLACIFLAVKLWRYQHLLG
jgi:hypothetical protein